MLTLTTGGGVAYHMSHYMLACGMVVTFGFMNSIDLAPSRFATADGSVIVLLNRVKFPSGCRSTFIGTEAATSLFFKRLLYGHRHDHGPLDQVLFFIGSVSTAVAGTDTIYRFIGRFSRASRKTHSVFPAWSALSFSGVNS